MKKFYAIICLAIASLTQLQAQAPQGFNYQATYGTNTGTINENDSGAYGSMDNICFWDRALTQQEISGLYPTN